MEYVKFNLLQVDSVKSIEGYWEWNNAYFIERDIYISESELTPRKIAKFLRESGYLSDYSKGRIRVDLHPEYCDWFIEILDKNTSEPIFALSTIH